MLRFLKWVEYVLKAYLNKTNSALRYDKSW